MDLRELKNKLRKVKAVYLAINFGGLFAQVVTRIIFRGIAFFIPVKRNRILFRSYEGRGYTCSPKYISEYMKNDDMYEIVWSFNNPELYDELRRQGIITVKQGSLQYFYYYLSSKVIVFNDLLEAFLPTTGNQVYINTWHGGGAYKKWGMLLDWNWMGRIRYHMTHKFNYFLSSCKLYTYYAAQAFDVQEKQFIDSGLPRNDILLADSTIMDIKRLDILSKIKLESNYNYVLYAPTYREFQGSSTYDIDFSELKQNLEDKFGGEWKILYRGHYYLENDSDIPDYVINVSSHDDMQEVLLVADVLITDYSSSVWDFGLLERPCFLYTPDKVAYESVTNYCIPLEEWPYPFALTNEALGQLIKEYDKDKYVKRLHAHQERLGIFEKGQACPTIADFIANIIK